MGMRAFRLLGMVLLGALPLTGQAQISALYADLNALEGVSLRPDNVLGYSLQNKSTTAVNVRVKGIISLRSQPMHLRYELTKLLRPGSNPLTESDRAQISWTTDAPALKELFLNYGQLPQGTVEYCVDIQPLGTGNEQALPEAESSCIYHTQDDLFAINLVDPEDKATLYDRYPVFSWITSYPFASVLTYRIRVAEQKPGQNPANAIARNNAMWQDNRIAATTAIYPLTAKPLEYGQPYVWTVDAYYKGLLLGGAETWRFILAEDSIYMAIPKEVSYLDIKEETGNSRYYAIGTLKLKYNLTELRRDSLAMTLYSGTKAIPLAPNALTAINGDNRFEIDFKEKTPLKHLKPYRLELRSQTGSLYSINFLFVNPDFL